MQKNCLELSQLQYSRIEEVDKIYVFLAGLNPKFDIVAGVY